jgi:hypothetical protein
VIVVVIPPLGQETSHMSPAGQAMPPSRVGLPLEPLLGGGGPPSPKLPLVDPTPLPPLELPPLLLLVPLLLLLVLLPLLLPLALLKPLPPLLLPHAGMAAALRSKHEPTTADAKSE